MACGGGAGGCGCARILGSAYATGKGVAKDARRCAGMRMAAEQGNASAQYSIWAVHTLPAKALPRIYREAVRWYADGWQSRSIRGADRAQEY